jgi:hypothetical protein
MKMLMHVTLPPLGPFSSDSHVAPLVFMLEGMIEVDRHHIRQSRDRFAAGMGPPVPPLALSGVRCGEDSRDALGDLLQCMLAGAGDRESLSVWRCAELREAGVDAHPVISGDASRILCSVRLPDGSIEDISQTLGGMPGAGARAYDGDRIARLLTCTLPPLGPYSPASHFAPLTFMLEGMIEVNRHHIRQARDRARAGMGPAVPPVYASGVRYKEDPTGEENWGDLYYCLQSGFGDCDRLTIWRCAELREAGIAAAPVIKWQNLDRAAAIRVGYPAAFVPSDGLWLVHCLVRFPDGAIEDISKNLGMGAEYNGRV